MKQIVLMVMFSLTALCMSCSEIDQRQSKSAESNFTLYPSNGHGSINPDTHLKITFKEEPEVGSSGFIRVFDYETDKLVDELDLSIPPGPTAYNRNPDATYTQVPYEYKSGNYTNANTKPGTPSGTGIATSDTFQLTIIGGFTDAFHFYPIIIHENTATIYLHHNLLDYDKKYYVTVDSTVLSLDGDRFKGIYGKDQWQFSTRQNKPTLEDGRLVVDDRGSEDFNTLQGALDFIPDFHDDTIEIFINPGTYEELIYFRNKSNVVINGGHKDSVTIQYANNEPFNPHPWNVKTNEWPGTFPSRRAAFAIDNCRNIQLRDVTVKTLLTGQAEGLLINGEKILVKDVHIVGSGDALQTNGTAYFENVSIDGGGDMILGRGPAFFKNCALYSPGPFMWIRNTDKNHGNVFVDCTLIGTKEGGSTLARCPVNKTFSYPHSEAVFINCKLDNIIPDGYGRVGGETENMRYWEYNSTDLKGQPIDVSARPSFSRQLDEEKDKELIRYYTNPENILNGWNPLQ